MKKFIINNTQLRKIYEATVTPKIVVPFDGNSVSDAVSAIDNPNVQKQLNTAQSAAGDCTIALQGSNYQDNGPTQSVKKDSGSSWGDAMTQQINPELFQQNPSAELNDTIDEGVKFTKKEIMERRRKKLAENCVRFTKKQIMESYGGNYRNDFQDLNTWQEELKRMFGQKIYHLEMAKGEVKEEQQIVARDIENAVEDVNDALRMCGIQPQSVSYYRNFDDFVIEYSIPWVPSESEEDDEIYSELNSIGYYRKNSVVDIYFTEEEDHSVITVKYDAEGLNIDNE